jgi:myo-inositol-1(or 4)-monophosphatase
LTQALAIMDDAAHLALQAFGARTTLSMRAKQAQDFVSATDEAVERLLRERLAQAFPKEPVLGEEFGLGAGPDAQPVSSTTWIVDPIDGTANFLRGIPLWSISLGWVQDGFPQAGVVAIPALGLTVAAERGIGLIVNGRPALRETAFEEVQIVSVGDARDDIEEAAAMVVGLRRAGWVVEAYRSTATAMAFAAMGRLDGHVQRSVKVWDMAGGLALCSAAGLTLRHGCLSEYESFVVVGTAQVHEAVDQTWPDLPAGRMYQESF